jgi:hypothetical protein
MQGGCAYFGVQYLGNREWSTASRRRFNTKDFLAVCDLIST